MSVFPQELYDIIISLCDQRSLISCSLVCRTWVPSSRIRHFANLRPLVISPASLSQVLLLVDQHTSTISPYIRSLVLKDWAEGPSGSNSSSFYAVLPRITGRMVAVESLTFHATDWDEEEMAHGPLKFLVFNFKDTLKTLELRDCSCRTFDSLVELACSFPALENLSLHRLARLDPRGVEATDLLPPALRTIHAHGYIKKELFRWFLATKCLDIEVVTIGPILPGEAPVVGKFLRALKNNLRHITISGESTPNLHRTIDLKHNWQLSSIHFTNLMLYHHGSGGRASMNWFIHLLLTVRSSDVRSLRFSVCVHSKSAGTLDVIDWLALRTCLEKPKFVFLTFSMARHKEAVAGRWWDGYVDMAEKFVRERLPQYQDTGILCFDFEKDLITADSDDESDSD
ncbi:hypothetical protein DFH07DRAFT_843954 [Mycena maculata]|uniref:F-box domain-containing protein n=1 Tax=Mycena maculata TaxID=230809 RepID=A0AAD7MW02_9AGAR|nr:hypothetical protein DFH07DRAFT_843954 [Mycena maculata]